jgi:L,D-peptidoglycan transpeptidase YkuD (ErfK/YbiS/YcfS/YnhG family)
MKILLLAALCLAGCKSRASDRPPERDQHEEPVKVPPTPILATSTQMITAVPADWTATTATLRLWHREPGKAWTAVGEPWSAVIGATGSAWGIGQHGDAPPFGHTGPKKQEGDKKSPAGAFAMRDAYGYAAAPPEGTRMPYTPSDDNTKCVDDPASLHYASIVSKASTQVDWHSAEDMRRKDAEYTWVIDIAHNPSRVPGEGSCIFLHVWKDADSPTVGCTAMPEPALRKLLAELDPSQKPTFVLLPRDEYTSLAAAWGLPAL